MVRFGLLQSLATCASAAYVQWQPCDDVSGSDPARFIPGALSAILTHVNRTHDRLSFEIVSWMEASECARWANDISSANLEIDFLGESRDHHPDVRATCQELPPVFGKFSHNLAIVQDTGVFKALSTFHTTIRVLGANGEEKACLQANITPEFGPAVKAALRYGPMSILLFVLLVGVARSVPIRTVAGPWKRSVLPGVADCLQYLQFVFLTGSLSLFYPGFYQPAVSGLNWMSLLVSGPITHGQTYPGIRDGIYELNGTYGGTLGLEIMTQISGAPMTMDTWLNMVIIIAIVTVASALSLELYRYQSRPVDTDTRQPVSAGLRHNFHRTLRFILSYFMMPLVALSFYQIDYATLLPAYHTSLAVLLVAVILIAFAWLLSQVPARSLGILIFDRGRRYRQLSSPSDTGLAQDKRFILVLFTLTFIRGAAIGGLQIWGPAQLAVLMACEVVLLACAVLFQAYGVVSAPTASALARLVSLAAMVTFVPGLASNSARSAVGYVVLGTHTCALTLCFFAPAAIHLGRLCARLSGGQGNQDSEQQPQIYGLRQLRRRPASRTDLLDCPSGNHPSLGGTDDHGLTVANSEPRSPDSPHPDLSSMARSHHYYYRPPRHSRLVSGQYTDGLGDGRQSAVVTSAVASSPSRRESPSPHSPKNNNPAVAGYSDNTSSSLSSSSSASTTGTKSLESTRSDDAFRKETLAAGSAAAGAPLGPRWGDYSFREADLYYGAPRPAAVAGGNVRPTRAPVALATQPQSGSLSPLSLWARLTGQPAPAERGFSVVRPASNPELSRL